VIGKLHLQQCKTSLARFLIVSFAFALLVGSSGCNLLNSLPDGGNNQTDDDKLTPKPDPGPLPAPKYEEADYWEALADLIEAGRFTNTDQIVLVVASQKTMGNIKDDSRIGEYQAKRQDVTDGNKAFIANKIRGGN
jgi:hypothetical protein